MNSDPKNPTIAFLEKLENELQLSGGCTQSTVEIIDHLKRLHAPRVKTEADMRLGVIKDLVKTIRHLNIQSKVVMATSPNPVTEGTGYLNDMGVLLQDLIDHIRTLQLVMGADLHEL